MFLAKVDDHPLHILLTCEGQAGLSAAVDSILGSETAVVHFQPADGNWPLISKVTVRNMRIEIKIILQNLQITVFAIQTFADTLKREDKGRTLLKRIVPVVDGIVIIGIINNEYGLPVIRNKFDIDPLVQRQLIVIAEIVDLAAEAESAVGADIKAAHIARKQIGPAAEAVHTHIYGNEIREADGFRTLRYAPVFRKRDIVCRVRVSRTGGKLFEAGNKVRRFDLARLFAAPRLPFRRSKISNIENPPYAVWRSFQSAKEAPLSCG